MAEFPSVAAFLNHSPRADGGGRTLKKWTDRGFLNFWLHTLVVPQIVYRHAGAELVIRSDRNDPTKTLRNVFFRSPTCFEDESILKKQRFKTPEGFREHPPKICPDCIMIEVVRGKILRGEIKDTDVVFAFTGSDKPEEDKVFHAGGLCGHWKRDPDQATKDRLGQHGIFMGNSGNKMGAWSENMQAAIAYVLAGVNQDEIAAGVQVAIEKQSLGEKVKKVINDAINSEGDNGNPFINPYAMQWKYNPNEVKFDDKYGAQQIKRFPLTPEIEALIRGPAPDISMHTRKRTLAEVIAHRTSLEQHAKVEMPWDAIFGPVTKMLEAEEARRKAAEAAGGAPAPTPNAAPTAPVASPAPAAPPPPAQEWGEPCEPPCNAPMLKGQTKCGKCGAEYKDEAPAPAVPPAAPGAPPAAGQFNDSGIPF